jgi:hypothetical protein
MPAPGMPAPAFSGASATTQSVVMIVLAIEAAFWSAERHRASRPALLASRRSGSSSAPVHDVGPVAGQRDLVQRRDGVDQQRAPAGDDPLFEGWDSG